jgi:hypothetical protein
MLSDNNLLFSAQEGVDSIVVDKNNFRLEGGRYDEECKFIGTGSDPNYCNNNYCTNFAYSNSVMKIECSWYSVTRIDEHTLIVSVNMNETGEERKQTIGVRTGNCGVGFSITQSAE